MSDTHTQELMTDAEVQLYMESMQQDAEQVAEQLTVEQRIQQMHNFYTLKYKNGDIQIELDNLRVINKLRELGFFRFDQPDGSYQYVHIKDNKISIVNDTQIKDAFENYVRNLPECNQQVNNDKDGSSMSYTVTSWRILEKLYKNMQYYFSSTLDRLRPIDKYGREKKIEVLHDERNIKYLFFKNCAVKIENKLQTDTASNYLTNNVVVENLPYSMLENGYIWQSSIIDRDFYYTEQKGDFEVFCECICGNKQDRKQSLMSILGYLMHDHYECDLRAAIFTDVNKEDITNAAGRTGKGLLAKALAYTLNRDPLKDCKMITVPGKGFDATNPKRYSAGDLSTQLIHIEDLSKRFVLDSLYGDITDTAVFQRHYQNPTYRRVKIMLSMNQAIRLGGSSDKGRVVVFELANFFSDRLRPGAYFGALHHKTEKRFFGSDWEQDDWNTFYSFMVRCCQIYLQFGIIEPVDINFTERAARELVGEDLWVYLDTSIGAIVSGNRCAYDKAELYNAFCTKYPGQIQTQRRFTELACEYLKCKNIRSAVWRDGRDWIILYPDTSDMNKRNIQFIVK